jgi:hypothetical protein
MFNISVIYVYLLQIKIILLRFTFPDARTSSPVSGFEKRREIRTYKTQFNRVTKDLLKINKRVIHKRGRAKWPRC